MQRTISIVLDPNPALAETVLAFNECCNFFLKLGFNDRTHSRHKLQSLGYYEARERWPRLQSSLVQGARDCAADMLRRERLKRLPVKKATSAVRYNQRTFKAFLESNMLSLSTVRGRIKVPLGIAPYFDRYRKGTVASVRVRNDHGMLRADLVMGLPDVPMRDVAEPEVVGMDRGINNIAVLSTGHFFNSRAVRHVRGYYAYNRRCLQSVGTRSARRHLRRLSGRERRFQTDVNHRIAKTVAQMDMDVLALEDLDIRKDRKLGRGFNRKLGGWAFTQLEFFLAYKLEGRGRRLVKVPPEYTSKKCSRCGNLGVRKGRGFHCPACGCRLDADLNAARNIASLGKALAGRPSVNGPIVAGDDAEHRTSAEPSCKPPVSMGGS